MGAILQIEQSNLFERDLSRGRNNPQSKAAHEKLAPKKPSLRAAVFSALALAGDRGGTLRELSHLFNKPMHSLSGRLSELAADNVIYRTNEVREDCVVWRARFAESAQ
jgi:hypothetical protein